MGRLHRVKKQSYYEMYRKNPIGKDLPDPFFDSYNEERAICSDILDRIGLRGDCKQNMTLTFNVQFLKKLIRSHILFIKTVRGT
jgi:hypothetical protein